VSDKDSNNRFMWFLAGLSFGALLGVLYAPRSGRETRDTILDTAEEGREFIKNRARDVRESVSQWVDRGRDNRERASEAMEADTHGSGGGEP